MKSEGQKWQVCTLHGVQVGGRTTHLDPGSWDAHVSCSSLGLSINAWWQGPELGFEQGPGHGQCHHTLRLYWGDSGKAALAQLQPTVTHRAAMLLVFFWDDTWSLNWTMTRVTNGGLIKDDGAARLEMRSLLPTDPPSCPTCDNILPVPSSLSHNTPYRWPTHSLSALNTQCECPLCLTVSGFAHCLHLTHSQSHVFPLFSYHLEQKWLVSATNSCDPCPLVICIY